MLTPTALRDRLSSRLPPGSLRARLVGGAFWSLSGAVATQGTAALAGIVTARILGKVGFGELGMVRNTIMMFATFAGLGLGLTVNKYVAAYRRDDPERAGRVLGLSYVAAAVSGVLMMVITAALAEYLAVKTLAAPRLAHYIRIATPLLLIGALAGVQAGALAGLEAFRVASIAAAVVGVLSGVMAIIGVAVAGMSGAIWAGVIAGTVGFVITGRVLARECGRNNVRLHLRGLGSESHLLWKFTLPSLLAGLMVAPVTWAASAMIVNWGGGFDEMGVFNAGNTWRTLVLFVPNALGAVALPMLASLHSSGEGKRYLTALKANVGLVAAASLVASAPLVVLSPYIMRAYGDDFAGGALVLVLLVLAAAVQAVAGVIGQAIASLGRMWWGFGLNLLWTIELLVATWLLLPYGARGLAGAYLISYVLHGGQVALFTVLVLRKHLASATPAVEPALPTAAVAVAVTSESAIAEALPGAGPAAPAEAGPPPAVAG